MLKLYKALEDVVTSDKTSGTEKAKCAEVAANIAVDVLKLESEGIKAVKELVAKNEQEKNVLGNINNNCLKMMNLMIFNKTMIQIKNFNSHHYHHHL